MKIREAVAAALVETFKSAAFCKAAFGPGGYDPTRYGVGLPVQKAAPATSGPVAESAKPAKQLKMREQPLRFNPTGSTQYPSQPVADPGKLVSDPAGSVKQPDQQSVRRPTQPSVQQKPVQQGQRAPVPQFTLSEAAKAEAAQGIGRRPVTPAPEPIAERFAMSPDDVARTRELHPIFVDQNQYRRGLGGVANSFIRGAPPLELMQEDFEASGIDPNIAKTWWDTQNAAIANAGVQSYEELPFHQRRLAVEDMRLALNGQVPAVMQRAVPENLIHQPDYASRLAAFRKLPLDDRERYLHVQDVLTRFNGDNPPETDRIGMPIRPIARSRFRGPIPGYVHPSSLGEGGPTTPLPALDEHMAPVAQAYGIDINDPKFKSWWDQESRRAAPGDIYPVDHNRKALDPTEYLAKYRQSLLTDAEAKQEREIVGGDVTNALGMRYGTDEDVRRWLGWQGPVYDIHATRPKDPAGGFSPLSRPVNQASGVERLSPGLGPQRDWSGFFNDEASLAGAGRWLRGVNAAIATPFAMGGDVLARPYSWLTGAELPRDSFTASALNNIVRPFSHAGGYSTRDGRGGVTYARSDLFGDSVDPVTGETIPGVMTQGSRAAARVAADPRSSWPMQVLAATLRDTLPAVEHATMLYGSGIGSAANSQRALSQAAATRAAAKKTLATTEASTTLAPEQLQAALLKANDALEAAKQTYATAERLARPAQSFRLGGTSGQFSMPSWPAPLHHAVAPVNYLANAYVTSIGGSPTANLISNFVSHVPVPGRGGRDLGDFTGDMATSLRQWARQGDRPGWQRWPAELAATGVQSSPSITAFLTPGLVQAVRGGAVGPYLREILANTAMRIGLDTWMAQERGQLEGAAAQLGIPTAQRNLGDFFRDTWARGGTVPTDLLKQLPETPKGLSPEQIAQIPYITREQATAKNDVEAFNQIVRRQLARDGVVPPPGASWWSSTAETEKAVQAKAEYDARVNAVAGQALADNLTDFVLSLDPTKITQEGLGKLKQQLGTFVQFNIPTKQVEEALAGQVAPEVVATNAENLANSGTPPQDISKILAGLDPWQQLLLYGGLAVGTIGALTALAGGDLSSWLMAALGGATAYGVAGNAGILDEGSNDFVRGLKSYFQPLKPDQEAGRQTSLAQSMLSAPALASLVGGKFPYEQFSRGLDQAGYGRDMDILAGHGSWGNQALNWLGRQTGEIDRRLAPLEGNLKNSPYKRDELIEAWRRYRQNRG